VEGDIEIIETDEAYDKVMKQIGEVFAALRKDIEIRETERLARDSREGNAQTLRMAFIQVEAFWDEKGRDDAVKWADDARRALESIDNRMADSRWEDAKIQFDGLAKTCAACHAAYRDKGADGTFRIKPGG
jgi:hypothetical protein